MPIVGTREFAAGACLEIEFLKLMRPTQQQQLERRWSDYLAVQCYCLWRLDQCRRLYLVLKTTKYRNKHVRLLISRSTMSWKYIQRLVWVQTERLHCA